MWGWEDGGDFHIFKLKCSSKTERWFLLPLPLEIKKVRGKLNGKLSDKYVETSVFWQRPGKRKEKEKEQNIKRTPKLQALTNPEIF